jgi:hypothetical protein
MSNEPARKPPDETLSPEALKNLTAWFDVLIRMDLEQKAKEERGKDVKKTVDQMYKKV